VPTEVPAHVKAHTTGRWAEIIFRALSSRVASRWQFVSFRGSAGGEWRGVIDVLAVRKSTSQPTQEGLKRGDLLEVVLIQVKGGSARAPTASDCERLRQVARIHRAKAVVLFSWNRGNNAAFSQLNLRTLKWQPVENAAAIFGT
jgi:hypothetical protein